MLETLFDNYIFSAITLFYNFAEIGMGLFLGGVVLYCLWGIHFRFSKKMLTIITIPADAVSSITAYIGDMFTDMYPLVLLCIGLPLAFWGVGKVISLVRAGFRTRTPRA